MRAAAGAVLQLGLGESEVEDLDLAVGRDLDVRRLEVAVHDARLVGGLESLGDLRAQRQDFLDVVGTGRTPGSDPLLEGFSLHQFHGEEADAVGLLEAVHGREVGVIERGEQPRLALEARQALGVVGELRGQHLDRDVAPQLGVARPVDLAHAACTQRPDNLVRPQSASRFHGEQQDSS